MGKVTPDVLLTVFSDMHSANNYALFPNRFWEGKHGLTHAPNSIQLAIYKQWEVYKTAVLQERKDRKLVVVVNGDAIEGSHHNNVDVCTRDLNDQAEIHIELMNEFKKAAGWRRGDELYYILGTETHTGAIEYDIAKELGAYQFPSGEYAANHLSLTINGKEVWFVHRGPKSGNGANRGNGVYNWLKNAYFDLLRDGDRAPDAIYSSHVHDPDWGVYRINENMNFRLMHGIITPSWQSKTRYAYGPAPITKNRVGGVTQVIPTSGDLHIPKFWTAVTETMMKA